MTTNERRLRKLEGPGDPYIVNMQDLLDFEDGTKIPTKRQEETINRFFEEAEEEEKLHPSYINCPEMVGP